MRNRIINGGMVLDQRNAGALINPAINGDYTLDRWRAISAAASKFSIGQNAGSVTPPTGFTYYLGLTSLSAYTVGASENFAVRQSIEGFNSADLAWGTANAATVTLSFWVRSSLTGLFGLTLRNSAQNRTFPATYTINAANTWEYKTITVVGDTGGTWLTTNGIGIELQFSIGAGASVSGGTVGTWNAASFQSPSGCVSVVGTNGATFYITGVQLEKGTQATGFEYRQYQQELALCQRYFYQLNSSMQLGTAAAYVSGVNFVNYNNPVTMRTAPSLVSNSAAGSLASNGTTPTFSTVTLNSYSNVNVIPLTLDGSTTAGYAYAVRMTSGSLSVSAEL